MKTYGSMKLVAGMWEVTAEPHVMIKLKACLGKVNKNEFGTVKVKHSDETCRDLEWFIQRYPLVCESAAELVAGADSHRRTAAQLEVITMHKQQYMSFPLEIPARDYQKMAAEIFLNRKALLLADVLGLGKSVTALAALTDRRTLPALVVVQTHLAKQWRDYAGRFMPMVGTHIIRTGTPYKLPEAEIYIITYHKLAGWADVLHKLIRCLVFDEVQELRHAGTGKYCAAARLREGAEFAIGLSATPIYNYGGEIFNILDIIMPGQIGTAAEFEREWCTHQYGGKVLLKDADAFGAYLRDQCLMVRRGRSEVGRELPALQTVVETIEYDESVLESIDAEATQLAHRILAAESSFHEKGEAAREFDMKMRQATGIAKAPFVAAFVRLLVEAGERVVLTGWYCLCIGARLCREGNG